MDWNAVTCSLIDSAFAAPAASSFASGANSSSSFCESPEVSFEAAKKRGRMEEFFLFQRNV